MLVIPCYYGNLPWLRDVKITHHWGNNIMTIQRNGTVKTIVVIKHLKE
jgi:hypothetical protein